jgi:hypothetical protein
MAKSKPKLPPTRRVQQTFADLLTDVSTLVPEPDELPSGIDKRKNVQVDAFMAKHKAVSGMWFTHVGKQWFEAQHIAAKKNVCAVLGIDEKDLEAGHDELFSFSNIGLRVKVDNGQNRLDRDTLRNVLMTDCKMSAEKAEEVITKASKRGKPPVHLTPALINS